MQNLLKAILLAILFLVISSCTSNSRVSSNWKSVAVKGTVVSFNKKVMQVGNSFTGIPEWFDSVEISVAGPFSEKCASFSILHQDTPMAEGQEIHLGQELAFVAVVSKIDLEPKFLCQAFLSNLKDLKLVSGV